MKIVMSNDYREMSLKAADIIARQIKRKPALVLGLATGSTPLGLYKELIRLNRSGKLDFSGVKTFNLDEYYPISGDSPQSYRYFMFENLFKHIDINPVNIHIPNGSADDVEHECRSYDAMIKEAGGIDLQVLGIGGNGHIGFNEPADELVQGTHLTALTVDTRKANSRFFSDISQVPTHAITIGMDSIMKAKKIILLASGANKADIVGKLLEGKITTDVPASLLHLHPDVTMITDREAACKVA